MNFYVNNVLEKKHMNHTNKLIKLSEYYPYIKTTLKELASELDKQILNDEAYQFFQYWNYDVENEINNINNAYEYIKNLLEDIKQMQVDYIIALGEANKYETLKQRIEGVINQYANIDTEADIDKIFEEKKILVQSSKEILTWYNELKNQCLNYTKTIKDIQTFNQTLLKELKDKFNITKKRYSQIPFINNNFLINGSNFNKSELFNNNNNNFIDTNLMKDNQERVKTPKNETNNENNDFNTESSKKKISNEKLVYKNNSPNGIINLNESFNNSYISSGGKKEKILFKLKDDHKIIIFFISKQSFKEKNFYDKGNFRKDFTTEADVIQLNLYGKLFMLSGKNFNKFYYYDFPSNAIYYLNNTLFSHYYGSMVHCPKNNSIYLLGGNNQIRCVEADSFFERRKTRICNTLFR